MKTMFLLLAAVLSGCASTAVTVNPRDPCPELPLLRQGATTEEVTKHHQAVITMYAQCAKGTKK